MLLQFNDITQAVQSLEFEEKIELQNLLNHYIVEEKRNKIYKNYQKSKKEDGNGKINYFKSSNDLLKALEND